MRKHIKVNQKRMTAMVMAGVMTCTLPLAGCSKEKNSGETTTLDTVAATTPGGTEVAPGTDPAAASTHPAAKSDADTHKVASDRSDPAYAVAPEMVDRVAAEKSGDGASTPKYKIEYSGDEGGVYEPALRADPAPGTSVDPAPHVGTDPSEAVPEDRFGILTAGRWNDNANWGFFKNLVTTEKIAFPAYGLNPVSRSAITVKNESGAAVEGVKVEAVYSDDNTVIWSGVSNKEGTAYLFLPESESRTWKVRIYDPEGRVVYTGADELNLPGKKEEDVPENQTRKTGYPEELELTMDTASKTYDETQVMFILDTTGSMGDELTYLQADFAKIMERVTAANVSYSWNFYRDEGDDYVTRTNGFMTDVNELKKVLNKECAAGGGDTPEAVAEILTETMNSKEWKEGSKKIAFMIFDAPPHVGTEDAIQAAIAKAAEQGIRLVPVIASNSDRSTELFGRALAIMTDGEYVFLTDDSGVGDSHLEPIIGDYEVQKLGDIIVDIINEFAVKAE